MRFLTKTHRFFRYDLWDKPLRDYKGIAGFFFRILRVIAISFRGFVKDDCVLRASALTYFTLLGLVPLVAISLGIAQGFGFKEHLQAEMMERFSDQTEVLSEVLNLAQSVLDKTKGGVLAIIAVAFLFWSVMKLVGQMESSFNRIWHAEERRSWRRKFGIYFFLLLLFPFFFMFSSGMKLYFMQLIPTNFESEILTMGTQLFYSLIPFTVIWLFFSFIYVYLPKKQVNLLPALLGGFVAGAIYEVIQWGYVVFQVGVSRYSAVYGSFAALPFFLISLQLGWMVFLYGVEIAHAVQNPTVCESEKKANKVALHFEIVLALWITYQVVERMKKNKKPLSKKDLYTKLGIPEALSNKIVKLLLKSHVLTAIKMKRKQEVELFLNGSIDDLKVLTVIEKILTSGESSFPIRSTPSLQRVKGVLKSFYAKLTQMDENTLIKDLL